MTGGLFDPLGTDRAEPGPRAARPSAPAIALGVMLVALAALLLVSWLRDSGDRGMPVATAPIEHAAPTSAAPAPAPAPAQQPPPIPSPAASTPAAPAGLLPPRDDQDVQIENGVRVVRPRRPAAAATPPVQGGQTLRVPDGKATR